MDLERPVQGTYLKKDKSAVSGYFRQSLSFSLCSPDGGFITPYQFAFSVTNSIFFYLRPPFQ